MNDTLLRLRAADPLAADSLDAVDPTVLDDLADRLLSAPAPARRARTGWLAVAAAGALVAGLGVIAAGQSQHRTVMAVPSASSPTATAPADDARALCDALFLPTAKDHAGRLLAWQRTTVGELRTFTAGPARRPLSDAFPQSAPDTPANWCAITRDERSVAWYVVAYGGPDLAPDALAPVRVVTMDDQRAAIESGRIGPIPVIR